MTEQPEIHVSIAFPDESSGPAYDGDNLVACASNCARMFLLEGFADAGPLVTSAEAIRRLRNALMTELSAGGFVYDPNEPVRLVMTSPSKLLVVQEATAAGPRYADSPVNLEAAATSMIAFYHEQMVDGGFVPKLPAGATVH